MTWWDRWDRLDDWIARHSARYLAILYTLAWCIVWDVIELVVVLLP
jgi:hypothetical protein